MRLPWMLPLDVPSYSRISPLLSNAVCACGIMNLIKMLKKLSIDWNESYHTTLHRLRNSRILYSDACNLILAKSV